MSFPYNGPTIPDETNRLPKRSHVKCDKLISVKPDNIIMKLGVVTNEQFDRFMEHYEKSIE